MTTRPTTRPLRSRAPRQERELAEQTSLFEFRDRFKRQYPELTWLHSSLNGVRLTHAQAGKAKASGMTAGVWDVFLPVPRPISFETWTTTLLPAGSIAPGLYIEMKAGRNGLTEHQEAYRAALEPQGYRFPPSQA